MWLGSETHWPLKRLQVLEIERDEEEEEGEGLDVISQGGNN